MDKEYINQKIKNCEKLVEAAISEEQKKVYQEYLDFWTKELPAKEQPEAIAKREEIKQKKLEIIAAKKEELERSKREKEEAELKKVAEIKAAKIAAKKAELAALEAESEQIEIFDFDFTELELEFEELYPGKKAYRTQNGDRIKTIAFKEFLNQRTQ